MQWSGLSIGNGIFFCLYLGNGKIVREQYTKEEVVAEEIKEEAVTNTEDTVKKTVNGTSGIKISKEELETETEINVGQVIEPDDFTITKAQAKENTVSNRETTPLQPPSSESAPQQSVSEQSSINVEPAPEGVPALTLHRQYEQEQRLWMVALTQIAVVQTPMMVVAME